MLAYFFFQGAAYIHFPNKYSANREKGNKKRCIIRHISFSHNFFLYQKSNLYTRGYYNTYL